MYPGYLEMSGAGAQGRKRQAEKHTYLQVTENYYEKPHTYDEVTDRRPVQKFSSSQH